MNIFANRYQFRARIIPEFLSVSPLVVLVVSFTDDIIVLGVLSITLFFILFQGHFSSQLGRKLEKKLKKNGKMKSNLVLIKELCQSERGQEIAKLIELASQKANITNPLSIPEEEEKNVKLLVDWLAEHTRDEKKFPAVFDKLCDYGFYRNMLALRWTALVSPLLSLVLPILPNVIVNFEFDQFFSLASSQFIENGVIVNISWVLFIIAWIAYWTNVITIKSLQQASQNYIETLIKAVHSVKSKPRTTSSEFFI